MARVVSPSANRKRRRPHAFLAFVPAEQISGIPERPHRRVALARPGLDVQIPAQDRAPHVQVPEVLDGLADEIANFLHLKRSRPRAVAPIVRLSVNVEQDEAPRPGPDAKADALDLALDVRVFAEPDGGGGDALPKRPRLHALRRLELVKAVFEVQVVVAREHEESGFANFAARRVDVLVPAKEPASKLGARVWVPDLLQHDDIGPRLELE
mmetsp:Transcript_9163/g.40331  ORF Transcript_9163/g.40331 Transcript_9163/m.40331 type:complete len:211 (-) Transcript_9163:541-1173(-)